MTAAQALYRRWRPQTFDEVVGQEHVTQTLRNAIAAGRISHAYLFAGPRGTGKTTMARLVAKAVNCLHDDPAARPCNQCSICTAVAEGRLLDLIEIDAASNRGIEDIRELRDKIHFSPAEARFKVYVIDETHMLTNEAFNALLKTLEEPPPHALFVLATTDPQKMPATVVSRCQRFDFRRLRLSEIVAQLEKLVTAEGLQAEPGVLELIARQATGAMRDALSLLDQLAAYSGAITMEQAQAALGVGTPACVSALVDSLAQGDPTGGLNAINQAVEEGADVRQLSRQIVERLRAVLLTRVGGAGLLDLPGEERKALEAQARKLSTAALVKSVKLFNQAASELRTSWQPQLLLELAYLESVAPPPQAVESAPPPPSRPKLAQPPPSTRPAPSQPPPVKPKSRPHSAAPSAAIAAAPTPADTSADAGTSLTLEIVAGQWDVILARLHEQGGVPVKALINSCRLVGVQGNTLVLNWPSQVLQDRFESGRTKHLVEQVASEVLGRSISTRSAVFSKTPAQTDPLVEEAVKSLGARVADSP